MTSKPVSDSKVMITTFFVILVAFIGFSMPTVILSPLFLDKASNLFNENTSDLTSSFLLGIAIAIFAIGQIISLPILGKLSDIFGRKIVLISTLLIAIIGIFITTFGIVFPSVITIIIGRFITGLAEGNIAIAQAIVSDTSPKELKPKRFAYIAIAVQVGFIIGPLLGGAFTKFSFFGLSVYAIPFVFAMLMYFMCLLLVVFFIPNKLQVNEEENKKQEGLNFKQLLLKLKSIYTVTFITAIGLFSIFVFYNIFLVKKFNFSIAELAWSSALLSIPLIISTFLVSRINTSNYNKLLIGCLFLMVGLIMFSFSSTILMVIVSATIACFGIGFINVVTSLLVSDNVSSENQGQALGIYRSIGMF